MYDFSDAYIVKEAITAYKKSDRKRNVDTYNGKLVLKNVHRLLVAYKN